MRQGRSAVGLLTIASLFLSAPLGAQESQTGPRHHTSPAAVAAPTAPEGSFDKTDGQARLVEARMALAAGHNADAHRLARAAVDAWPADLDAWQTLVEAARADGDEDGARRAEFFRSKVEFAANLPVRGAVLGFQTIAEEPVGSTAGSLRIDQATHDEASRLWSFYDLLDKHRNDRDIPHEPGWAEKYPFGATLLTGGVVAGLLTAVKSMANR